MKLWQRIAAWAIWRLNGWDDPERCRFECVEHPELSMAAMLARDYWYVRQARRLAKKGVGHAR